MERPLLSESLAKVTFDDAAVYFSEEQWQNLEEFQKKIYKELIKEIYETMLALGYRIPKPEIVSRIERGEEPCGDPNKKPKQQETQPQGAPDGSKDSEPVIKVERESPVASAPVTPNEISSSQERGGAQCPRCGTCCNNQCGRMGFQWSGGQGMYPGSPMDTNHGKPYMTPPPSYFNGSPISPGYANRGEGMSHPTSPMASYGNPGMVPLSPHYAGPGYRNSADPSPPFQMPERPANPVFAFDQMPMGPPASHVDLDNRNRNPHMQNAVFHDRRNPVPPCPGCGAFCNNQCGMNVHWEQRRLHHPIPGSVDVTQGHRYTSPPNPYFSGGANPASFSNIRPPVRHGTPPVNVQGNSGMMQMSAPYPGYRRPGDKSPNVFPNKPEHHGNNAGASSPHHGPNQGVKYGMVPANNNGNYRKSPLAAIETMPVFSSNNSPGAVGDQRNRPLPQTVTSSDNNRNAMNSYSNGRQNQLNFSNHGAKNTRVQPATSATGNTAGQQRSGDMAGNKNAMPSDGGGTASRNTPPSSSSFIGQVVQQVILNESLAAKRPAVQTVSESGIPTKRASPAVIIVDCDEEKGTPTQKASGNNNPGSACVTLSTTKSSLPSAPVAGGSHDTKKTPPPENKRPETPPIEISNVRSGGLFLTPPSKETMKDSGPIIIIDDKDGEGAAPPRASPASSSNIEVKTYKAMTPPAPNPKINKGPSPAPPPASSTNKTMQPQGGQQGAAVLVNKVQMQQPSPIIVTGGPGLGNQPLSVPVNGNQSIMLTFPVTVNSSGIMLATPMANRVPISKNTRLVPTNTATASRNVNPKFSSVAVTPVIGQTNALPVAVPPGHAKPVAINVNQSGNLTGAINIKNSNVNGGALKAVPVSAAGNQTIPLFVDANSGLILTGSAVPSKDNGPSNIGNATVVAVNRGVVAGNVAPVTLGGKLAFGNIAPVNGLYIGGNSPVALAGNANKGTLSINNPTILTLNGGLGIGNSRPVAAPVTNIASVNANRTLQVAQAPASTVVGGGSQQNNTVILRKVDEKSGVSNQAGADQQPAVVGERLFKCSECDEKFNSLENLTSHRAVHKSKEVPAGGQVGQPASKDSGDNQALPRTGDDDAPTILYTTQGDDGSTVYVVTV